MEKYDTDLFLNTEYQKKRRIEMLKGIQHRDCASCWQLESSGATSLRGNSSRGFMGFAARHRMFDEFPDLTPEQISQQVTIDHAIAESRRPFMLEVSLGNTCDMKCMYCNHVHSSQWATEGLRNKTLSIDEYRAASAKPKEKFIELFWKWVNIEAKHSVERIGIIGGEPLITPEFYDFLDKLIAAYEDMPDGNTTIWIVTNMNSEEKYFNRFIEYIPKLSKKFKLEIHISMESLYDQAEYIRNGLDWKTFEQNVNQLFNLTKNTDTVTMAFLPSITALSIPRLKDFFVWVYDICSKYQKPALLKQNIVTWPKPHSPFVLPSEFADYIDSAVEWLGEVQDTMPLFPDVFGRWKPYQQFLISLRDGIRRGGAGSTETHKEFFNWFNTYDQLRGLDFRRTFPELVEFYNKCEQAI